MTLSQIPSFSSISWLRYISVFLLFLALSFYSRDSRGQMKEGAILFSNADTTLIQAQINQARLIHMRYPDSARNLLYQALQNSRNNNYGNGIRNAHYEMMAQHFNRGQFPECIDQAKLLIQNSSPARHQKVICEAYLCIGMAYEGLEQFQMALEHYQKALPFAEDSEHQVYVYNNISSVLFNIGQYSKAQKYIDKAFALTESPGSIMLSKKAYMCMMSNDIPNALLYFDSAYQVAATVDEKVNILFRKIIFLSEHKQEQHAVTQFEKFGPKHFENDSLSPNKKAELLLSGGIAYYSAGKYKLAMKYLLETRTQNRFLGQPEQRVLLHKLSDLYYATKDYKQAYDLHKLMHQLEDSVKANDVLFKVNELETKYRTAQKDKDLAEAHALNSEHKRELYRNGLLAGGLVAGLLLLSLLLGSRYYYQKQKNRQLWAEKTLEKMQASMEGEEKERTRLSHELHDGVNSSLAATISYLQVMAHEHPEIIQETPYKKVSQLLAATSSEIRAIAHNLAPHILISNGLFYAIEAFCHNLFPVNVQVEIQTVGKEHLLPRDIALFVYRITQELLHNVHKHAHAGKVSIMIHIKDLELELRISDNGIGISDPEERGGIGLLNIRKKVQSHRGSVHLSTNGIAGTSVRISLPFPSA
jgi:signal transduction histidine kinase